MRSLTLFNLAALVASSMVLSIAFILIPEKIWDLSSVVSIIIFAISIGFVFYIPSIVAQKQSKGDSASLATLGPLSFISSFMIILSLSSFVLSILGFSKLSLVLNIFSISTFLISLFILNSALKVITDIDDRNATPSQHITWNLTLQSLKSIAANTTSKILLENISEKLRYSADDVIGGSPQDTMILTILEEITSILENDSSSEINNQISKLEILIEQRNFYLRSIRSKA